MFFEACDPAEDFLRRADDFSVPVDAAMVFSAFLLAKAFAAFGKDLNG